MTTEELKKHLQQLYDQIDQSGIAVYAILKGEETAEPKKLDIEAASLPSLKALFIESLKEKLSEQKDLALVPLSSSDERTNAIYLYDLEVPQELTHAFNAVAQQDGLALFNFSEKQLLNIKALLIEIGNNECQIILYKSMSTVNIFGQSSYFLMKHQHRIKKIEDDFMRISSGFQLLKIGGEILVLELSVLEKTFGFHDVIKREATISLKAIQAISLLENIEVLSEMIEDVKYARKFTKIAQSSPVLKEKIKNDRIIHFCKTFPKLKGKIRFNDAENKIRLDTKVSKELFIQLLMDDFLTSELTHHHYTSLAKNEAHEDPSAPMHEYPL
jgi:Domain of unknown function (DUF4868)